MWLLDRWRKPKPEHDADEDEDEGQHSVLLHVALSDDGYGTEQERDEVHALEDQLEEALDEAGVGEVDGHEFGRGEAVIFLYGPDKDRLLAIARPLVDQFALRPVFALLSGDDADAEPERVDL